MPIQSVRRPRAEGAAERVAAWGLALIAGTTLVQQVTWRGRLLVPEEAGGDYGVKPYHLLLALWGVITVAFALVGTAEERERRPDTLRAPTSTWGLHQVVVAYLVTLLAASTFGQLGSTHPSLSPLYVLTSGATGWSAWYWSQRLPARRCLGILRGVSLAFITAVTVKAIMYRDVLLRFWEAPNGHPLLPTIVGGGPNLEATWMALLASLWLGRRSVMPLALASMGIATLYASRIGIVLSVVVLIASVLHYAKRHVGWALLSTTCGIAMVGMMVFTAFGTDTIPAASYVTERFASIGDDPGSVGRLVLWQGGLDVWRHYPWGVGVGHAISALEHLRGIDVPEDNLHNLPLQHLVEGGPLLALLLLGCMLLIFRQTAHAWRGARVDLPIWLFVALYCVTGWLQFRGADVIAWTILGCAIGTAPRRRSRLTQMADRDRSSLPGRPDLSCR